MPTLPNDFTMQLSGANTGASNWCWLAVAASIDDYYAQPTVARRQCDMAHRIIPTNSPCCNQIPLPAECDRAGDLGVALGPTPGVNRLNKHLPSPATNASDIRSEISHQRPLAVKITFIDEEDGNTAHALAIINAHLDTQGD